MGFDSQDSRSAVLHDRDHERKQTIDNRRNKASLYK